MGKKFLKSVLGIFASFSAAVLLSTPSANPVEASAAPNTELKKILKQKTTFEISDFVLKKSVDADSTVSKWHSSHRSHSSHSSHSSHRSHYSSRW